MFALREPQRFEVIFYNSESIPMPGGPIPRSADQQAKNQLRSFLRLIDPDGGTDPRPAMKQALSLRPDAVFLLSDGAFPDGTVDELTRLNKHKVPIHCIDLTGGLAGDHLKRIAEANNGDMPRGWATFREGREAPSQSMARPEEDGVEEEPLRSRRHRPVVGVVGKGDDVSFAQTLVKDQGLAGHQLEGLRPAEAADEQVAWGEVHEVATIGRLERSENQVGVDQGEDLGRRAESDEMVVVHRGAEERPRDGVGRLLGLVAVGLRLGRDGGLVSLLDRFLVGLGLRAVRARS